MGYSLSATSELEDHVDGAASLKVVVADLHLVGKLLSSEDKSDLVNHDSFLLLECLLHLQNGVLWVEVETLSLSS
jgi:hypothetical protein